MFLFLALVVMVTVVMVTVVMVTVVMMTVVMVTVTIGWFFDVFHWRGDCIFFIKRAAALGTDHITLEQTNKQTNKRNVYLIA